VRKLVALLAAVSVVLTAASAQAAGRPSLTLSLSTFRVLYGHPVTLSGRLSDGRAGVHVAVLAQRYGQPRPVIVKTVTTNARGHWHFRARPAIQTTYTARTAATASRSLTVGVQPRVSLEELGAGAVLATVTAGRSLSGKLVKLQQRNGGTWQTIAQKPLRGSSSVRFAPAGLTGVIRVAMSVNQAGAGYLGTMSHPLLYLPYRLTLVPSSYKVLYGGTLTLSGRVVNGRSGQRVAIDAWPYGRSAPVRLATVVTGPGGKWSHRVRPRIQTTYQARWAGTERSPRVTVGVKPLITVRVANGRIVAHVEAIRAFHSRLVKLQRLMAGGVWATVKQKPLNRASTAVFATPLPSSRVRVAMSVNQAGVGFLGSSSHIVVYRAP
jgi:hypothetical protein